MNVSTLVLKLKSQVLKDYLSFIHRHPGVARSPGGGELCPHREWLKAEGSKSSTALADARCHIALAALLSGQETVANLKQ